MRRRCADRVPGRHGLAEWCDLVLAVRRRQVQRAHVGDVLVVQHRLLLWRRRLELQHAVPRWLRVPVWRDCGMHGWSLLARGRDTLLRVRRWQVQRPVRVNVHGLQHRLLLRRGCVELQHALPRRLRVPIGRDRHVRRRPLLVGRGYRMLGVFCGHL